MNLDRPYLKQQAKALLSTARPSPISAAAVYVALSALMGFLSARLVGVSYETVERAMRFLEQGKADYALTILSAAQPAPSAWLINLALELVMWIVAVGFTIFVLLWSLLLIVPGIIAAYRYSMATYVLIDHPEYGVMDCLRESRRLTEGRKGELFRLDLSFLGWLLLTGLPYVGYLASLWVTPYYALTHAMYYERYSGHVRE